MVNKAAEFRAQLERRRAQRTAVPQAQPQSQGFAPQAQAAAPARAAAPAAAPVAAASATAAPAAPAAVSAAPAVVSSDVKAKLSNPAALQRGWQTALADLKRQRAAYGALLLSARIVAEPDASGIAIEFSPENSFAFSAAQKPDITAAIESALSASFGGPVPFRVTQGSAAGGAAPVASASAPAPTAPAIPAASAAVHRAQQSVRAQVHSAGPSRQAPQAVAAPPWEDDVVPYTDADIAAYMPEEERSPFTEPDASLTVGAPSHREAASQPSEPAVFAKPAKNNPFAGRKMPEGIGRGVPAQPEATVQSAEPTVSSSAGQAPKTAPESAPAKKRKTAADKLAEVAVETARCAQTFGIETKVAMLSFSTKGSGKGGTVQLSRDATAKAKELAPDLAIDGEMQFDAAVSPVVGQLKFPGSKVAGYANTFIFPCIEAGNIGYKIAQRLGGYEAYGPILLGLNAPINDLSRGCNADEVYKMAIITAALV